MIDEISFTVSDEFMGWRRTGIEICAWIASVQAVQVQSFPSMNKHLYRGQRLRSPLRFEDSDVSVLAAGNHIFRPALKLSPVGSVIYRWLAGTERRKITRSAITEKNIDLLKRLHTL